MYDIIFAKVLLTKCRKKWKRVLISVVVMHAKGTNKVKKDKVNENTRAPSEKYDNGANNRNMATCVCVCVY